MRISDWSSDVCSSDLIEKLCVSYGDLTALQNVDIHVAPGAFVAIVGANGAGKTTLFKSISGVIPIAAGSMRFEGHDILQIEPARRARLGIAHELGRAHV